MDLLFDTIFSKWDLSFWKTAIIQQVGVENIFKGDAGVCNYLFGVISKNDSHSDYLLSATNISSSVRYYGDNNSLQQEVIGNNKSFEITHVGNDNERYQIDTGFFALRY